MSWVYVEPPVPPPDLLKSQKNEVFEALSAAGFDPAGFKWGEVRGDWYLHDVPVLDHIPSRFYFIFDFDPDEGHKMAAYSPGREVLREEVRAGNWEAQLGCVHTWLENLKRESHAPNLWAELDKQRELNDALPPSDDNNEPFSPSEQAAIAGQLDEIKELLVRTEQLTGARLAALEADVDYVKDASTRMGRRDWLTIFYGTVFGWALTALVAPDGARQAIMMATHGLGYMFGHSLPQLGR